MPFCGSGLDEQENRINITEKRMNNSDFFIINRHTQET
jgi:hypothetical protein